MELWFGMVWSLLVFPCLPFVSFLAFMFPVTVSVGFLSAFVSFCWSRFFFSYPGFSPAAFAFCQVSAFPPVVSFRLQIVFFMFFFIFIRWFRFSVWFCVLERSQNEDTNEGKIDDKQLGMDLPRSWQTFTPILLPLRLRSYGFAAGICLTTTSKAPTPPPRWLLLAPLLPLLCLCFCQRFCHCHCCCWMCCWVCCCAAAGCAGGCHCCRCCLALLLLLLLLLFLLLSLLILLLLPLPLLLFLLLALRPLLLVAPLLLLRIRMLILPHVGAVFLQFLPLLPLARHDDCAISHVYLPNFL